MEKNLIFIVGNSRSGTTMVGSILNMNKKVFTFEELHFFGQLWSEDNLGKTINYLEASRLLKKLFIIQRELGYFGDIDIDDKTYEKEIKIILDKTSIYTLESIFSDFLFYETQLNDKSIPCEQTPRNLFYMKEILRIFPNVKIINMVRDPRDVLLSQKNKWKVRKNGISNIPFKEVFRSWINYHPLTISKLWTSSIKMSELYEDKILNIRFEDLIFNSEKTVSKICDYLGIEFDNNMLEIPQIGSSTKKSEFSKKGIDKTRKQNWLNGGLRNEEIYICQFLNKNYMNKFGYEIKKYTNINYFIFVYYMVTFPIKLALSLILNISRVKNIVETIKRRL
mgnify:CR=1 FL=1